MAVTMTTYLSAVQVCQRARISYRQLDYWERLGLVKCRWVYSGSEQESERGTGHHRRFTEEDCRKLMAVAALRRAGLEMPRIRRIVEAEDREQALLDLTGMLWQGLDLLEA